MNNYSIAVDVGAGSVKMVAAAFNRDKLQICDEFVIANDPVHVLGNLYINIHGIYENIKTGIMKFSHLGGYCDTLGIDTYGNGYGILDKNGHLIGTPYYYKDVRTTNILDRISEVISLEELYMQTGVYPVKSRVLAQLYCDVLEDSPAIHLGKVFLPFPNLLSYFFTGETTAERSIASVASLLDNQWQDWNYSLLTRLSIPNCMFPKITSGGTMLGEVTDAVAADIGCGKMRVVNTISHDTESALIAAPGFNMNKLFVSLGTSFIFGTQTEKPVINNKGYEHCYKNMSGAFGVNSLCKDFPGFWILNQCMREWQKTNPGISYDDICLLAMNSDENNSYINVSSPTFRLHSENMLKTIQDYFIQTRQPVVDTIGGLAKCLFESYALQIKWSFECLKEITGKTDYSELVAVSGGTRNHLLVQMIADALGMPVTTGSPVASSVGNILTQLYAKKELSSLEEMREVAFRSFDVKRYECCHSYKWDEALGFMKSIMNN